MSEEKNNRATTVFIGLASGTLGALVALGVFLFAFQFSGISLINGPSSSSESSVSEEVIIRIEDYEDIAIPVAKAVSKSIVGIRVSPPVIDEMAEQFVNEASGVIYTSDGYIITNQHVVADNLSADGKLLFGTVIEVYVEGDDTPFSARLIGHDMVTDLALLKINTIGLTPAIFGDSDLIEIGQAVIAIGSPGGLKYMGSVTSGIISGINREVEFDDGTVMQLLQTDAALNPGNSGGALVDVEGKVIGINNAAMDKSTYEGINFAIPSNLVIEIIEKIKEFGYVSGRPWLGISILSDTEFYDMQYLYDLPNGVMISSIDESGPCSDLDILPNDVITQLGEVSLNYVADLRRALNSMMPGEEATITLYRPITQEYIDVNVTLGERHQ